MGDVGDAGRGQIMVIGALLIAVVFVGLALVLNGAIYTENMATRETTSTLDAVSYANETETRLQRAATEANWNEDDLDYSTRRSMVEDSVGEWDRNIGSEGARRGVVVSGRVEGTTEGVRVSQKEPGDFMPADEDLDEKLTDTTIDPFGLGDRTTWMVSSDASTRNLVVNVSRKDNMKMVDQSRIDDIRDDVDYVLTGHDEFWMHFDDGDVEHRVYLFNHDSEGEVIAVITRNGSNDESLVGVCSAEGDWVTIDFEERKLHGDETTACSELSFQDDLGDHDMYWVGADEIHGTYHFFGDQAEVEFRNEVEDANQPLFDALDELLGDPLGGLLDDPDADLLYGERGDPHPFTTTAIWDATMTLTYQDSDVRYEREISLL